MEDIKGKTTAAINFLEANYKLSDKVVEYFDERIPALKAVFESDREFNKEEELIMLNRVTDWANQLAFILFREQKLSKEAEQQFRSIAPLDLVQQELAKYGKPREERMNKVLEEKKVIDDELHALQIFTAELNGISKEEAEAKQAEYNQRNAAIQQG